MYFVCSGLFGINMVLVKLLGWVLMCGVVMVIF